MLQGYRTYITLAVMVIYNVALPALGIKDMSIDTIDMTVNTILVIVAAVFRKIAKLKNRIVITRY
ncbi:MAG: hypothetical protein DDT22_01154 [candidate division WS2 bacterium]|nr:hypothetical protein [Candidatus Lithacetigena glycinireducens]